MKYTPYSIWKAGAFLLTRRSLETTPNVGILVFSNKFFDLDNNFI